MENTNLTKEQNEILTFIEDQFVQLNAKNQPMQTNFIDVDFLKGELNRRETLKSELKVHNDAMEALRKNILNNIAEKLNKDFINANLPLIAKVSGWHVTIGGRDDFGWKIYCTYDVHIYVHTTNKYHEFGSKMIDFYYSNDYSTNPNALNCKTVEEVLNNEKTKQKLIKLLEECRKCGWEG